MARQSEQSRTVETADQRAERQHRQQHPQPRIVIEESHRPADGEGHKPQQDSAKDLNGPGRIQEHRIIAMLRLNDAGRQSDIRKKIDADDQGSYKCHLAEISWKQQPGQDQTADDAQAHIEAVLQDGPNRSTQRGFFQGASF